MKTSTHDWHTKLLLPIALLGLASTGLLAADFAQWRGPQRDGHSTETTRSFSAAVTAS